MATTMVRKLLLQITADDVDAETKMDAIKAKADEFRTLHPELTLKIDTAEATAKMAVLREELKREAGNVKVKVEPDVSQFRMLLDKVQTGLFGGGGGAGSAAGGGGGLAGAIPSSALMWGGIAAGAVLISPLIAGIVNGLVAATAGIGAFALLALPTFDKVKNAYTAISTAQTNYNNALAMEKEFPTKAHAAAATTALQKLQVAQEQAGPSTTKIIDGIHQLTGAFSKMATAFEPTVLKVFNDGLAIANTLLPDLKPFADAAGGALDGLLKKAGTFFQSADFKKWLDKFLPLVGPSITAIGTGFGKVAVQVGHLLTVMSAHDVVHALNIAFDIIAGTLRVVSGIVVRVMHNWDDMSSRIAAFSRSAQRDLANWAQVVDNVASNVAHWFTVTVPAAIATAIHWFEQLPGKILAAIGNLGSDLFTAGKNALSSLLNGMESMVGSLVSKAAGIGHDILNALGSPFGIHFSEPSEATQVVKAGMQVARGLGSGMAAGRAYAASQAHALGTAAFPAVAGAGAYGGAYGGRIQLEFVGADTAMATALKKMIRVRGGDPAVIGR